ncbi:MAG: hypothetical protein DRR19_27850 [Candidatus Parabeggiatoa sp. nov. 1]|nr:MAG: hypothetical protein DRR19_27850 [Gammaproteobacteria bacterium]
MNKAAYDVVGKYNQDQINGFDEPFLESLVKLLGLENADHVLDAMGGDGNLTCRMLNYCSAQKIEIPAITLLEYSSVQTDLARSSINSERVSIVHGDVLSMTELRSGKMFSENSFDRIIIKSGNHEIPTDKQYHLYHSIFRVLKPGGRFINLGFLFNDVQERDELAEITKVKDGLIGAVEAVENRYFLMRDELYELLNRIGFEEISGRISFDYVIRSEIVDKEYFSDHKLNKAITEILTAQSRAMTLRQHRRIVFDGERSVMRLPGEVTIAVKPL